MSIPERLLTVATRLFAVRGFERTSVQEIVTAAGVTKGGFYHYFSSKDDLLAEIYGRLLSKQLGRLEAVASGDGDTGVRLRAAAIDVVVTTLDHLEAVTIVSSSLNLLDPEVRRSVRADRRRYHDRFCEMVIEGQQSGDFRADITPDLMADFFFGAVHYLPMWFRVGGAQTPEEVADHFADLLMSALLPPTMRSADSA